MGDLEKLTLHFVPETPWDGQEGCGEAGCEAPNFQQPRRLSLLGPGDGKGYRCSGLPRVLGSAA